MTIKFYNNNEAFGQNGPFEADSKEELADGMESLFRDWAEHEDFDCDLDEWIELKKKEFIAGLVAEYHGEPRIIFDNGGGITLQLPGFAHTYQDTGQCAEDIKVWIEDENTNGWDSNEKDAVFEPTMDEISNGGYRVEALSDFVDAKNSDEYQDSGWRNVKALHGWLMDAANNDGENHPEWYEDMEGDTDA